MEALIAQAQGIDLLRRQREPRIGTLDELQREPGGKDAAASRISIRCCIWPAGIDPVDEAIHILLEESTA